MLKKIIKFTFELELLTGMHIGGSEDIFDIGGADNTVVKNPLTSEPYIPGSSFKGKMKALLTYRYGRIVEHTLKIQDLAMLSLFEPVTDKKILVSRAIFRDLYLTEESKQELQKHLGEGCFTEIKAENSIDPLKGKAANPRMIERIPAGAKFNGEIIVNVFDEDDEDHLRKSLLEGIEMLELNYLGGSGTRGYGRVKVNVKEVVEVE